MNNISLYHGDCLDIMRQLPEHSVDCVICDLPYGMTACKWDSVIPFDALWEAYKRVCNKDAAIVLFGSQPFTSALVMSNPKIYKHNWVWQKNRGSNFACVRHQPMREHEDILVFCYGKHVYNPIMQDRSCGGKSRIMYKFNETHRSDIYGTLTGGCARNVSKQRVPSSIQKFNTEVGLHPTQKPVALCEYLIKTYTNEGMTVMDNCMGSGSTGIACLNTKRNFIGIEKDKNYFEVAKKRIQEHKVQYKLF